MPCSRHAGQTAQDAQELFNLQRCAGQVHRELCRRTDETTMHAAAEGPPKESCNASTLLRLVLGSGGYWRWPCRRTTTGCFAWPGLCRQRVLAASHRECCRGLRLGSRRGGGQGRCRVRRLLSRRDNSTCSVEHRPTGRACAARLGEGVAGCALFLWPGGRSYAVSSIWLRTGGGSGAGRSLAALWTGIFPARLRALRASCRLAAGLHRQLREQPSEKARHEAHARRAISSTGEPGAPRCITAPRRRSWRRRRRWCGCCPELRATGQEQRGTRGRGRCGRRRSERAGGHEAAYPPDQHRRGADRPELGGAQAQEPLQVDLAGDQDASRTEAVAECVVVLP
mmetsp:Transcript_47002/g.130824  ORF Transcript_47002/g.130824 Transcript_47002/m.130824 type:complete len:340 (+) Transcript_47002:893-1912(+)